MKVLLSIGLNRKIYKYLFRGISTLNGGEKNGTYSRGLP
jgi:hypothetical protein